MFDMLVEQMKKREDVIEYLKGETKWDGSAV